MADTKFSGASAVTTLAGTEEFPLAASGASKKITAANLRLAIDHLGLTPTAVKTAATYTAAVGDFVPCDTTSNSITVTLPTAPADGSVIAAKQVIRGGTNTVTIACGGSDVFNKAAGSTTATLTVSSQAMVFQYKATGAIWYIVADDTPAGNIPIDTLAAATDITTLNASTSAHGLMPKLANDAAKVFTGTGTQVYPPGTALGFKAITSNGTSTATVQGSATALITMDAITFDGTAVTVTFCGVAGCSSANAGQFNLWVDSTDEVRIASTPASAIAVTVLSQWTFTPAAGSKVLSIRAWSGSANTITLFAGSGTGGNLMTPYLRVTKA